MFDHPKTRTGYPGFLGCVLRDYQEDIDKGYHYIGPNHKFYINLFEENLREANKGLHYIPEELRGPILKANKLYMDVAERFR